MWASWPHACITPGFCEGEAQAGPLLDGQCVVAARRATVAPAEGPRIRATTPWCATPVLTSSMPILRSLRPRPGPCAPRGSPAPGGRGSRAARRPRPGARRSAAARISRPEWRAQRLRVRRARTDEDRSVASGGEDGRAIIRTRSSRSAGGEASAATARPKLPEPETPDPDAHPSSRTSCPDGRTHAADLPVLPFREHDLQPGRALARAEHLDTHRPRAGAVVERQALAQRTQRLGVGHPGDPRVVGLGHVLLGRRQPLAEAVVVGEDQQPGAVAVEPAHREHPARHPARATSYTVGRPPGPRGW